MAKDLKFINSLGLHLSSKAEQQIQSNLLCEFYDQLDQDDDLLGDRKFASMSDIKEVRDAFNKFYNLTSTDEEYLN
jgi:phosphomannomutase